MNPLVSLLLRSIAGKAFQKAPEGSALNFMGTQMERYDPISGIMNLASNIPAIGRGIEGIKNTLAPNPYGTSQAQFESYQTPYDINFGQGSFQDLVSGIYGDGGIMQGYNPVSAFGRGPVGAISNRIENILSRPGELSVPGMKTVQDLISARQDISGGDSSYDPNTSDYGGASSASDYASDPTSYSGSF